MFLLLDLSAPHTLHLALFDQDRVVHEHITAHHRDLLLTLDRFLAQEGLRSGSIQGIIVVVGAGSFTSTRMATTVANTFGYMYQIPLLAIVLADLDHLQSLIPRLLAQPRGQYISATYSAEPNIRMKK